MLVNKKTFNLQSKITDNWGGSHRLELDLKALSQAEDWEIGLDLPKNYQVKEIYGAKIQNKQGKYYLSGSDWNKSLNKGQKSQIVLIVDEGKSANSEPIKPQLFFANQTINAAINSNDDYDFKLNSTITDDWGGSHRVVLDLEALSTAKNWKAGLDLAQDYEIKEIYGGKISYQNGKPFISGENWNKNLNQGQKAQVVLIVDEGKSASAAPITPQLMTGDSISSPAPQVKESQSNISNQPKADLGFDSHIVEDWNGGYKLEVDIKAKSNATNWQADFSLPYKITAAYGVDLIDRGNGNYTIDGQADQTSLSQGQSISPIFIIDDGGKSALKPQFESKGEYTSHPVSSPTPTSTPKVQAVPDQKDITANAGRNGKVIDVDRNFDGNISQAISSAQDGDVVKLGNKTYYTSGITIDKNIILDGQGGTVINGGGTNNSIIYLSNSADGATIQDLEITNGNMGINGNGAANLTLQNLKIHNIGLSNTIRSDQNNIGINLDHAEGLVLRNSQIYDIGRKGVSVGDTDGADISGIDVRNVNLAAQHAQSHDAAGIKFFNTNDVTIRDSYFSDINAMSIWNDTTNGTLIQNNVVEKVGEDFKAPSFNKNVDISGIYNEKSSNSTVKDNTVESVGRFIAFRATEFTTQTQNLGQNDFSSIELGSTDYWVNESAEKLIAVTEDPDRANFSLFANEYNAQANIG